MSSRIQLLCWIALGTSATAAVWAVQRGGLLRPIPEALAVVEPSYRSVPAAPAAGTGEDPPELSLLLMADPDLDPPLAARLEDPASAPVEAVPLAFEPGRLRFSGRPARSLAPDLSTRLRFATNRPEVPVVEIPVTLRVIDVTP